MPRLLRYIMPLILVIGGAQAQVRVMKPVAKPKPAATTAAIYAGVSNSVLLLERNTKSDNNVNGFHVGAAYGLPGLYRGTFEYTQYNRLNIEPTWYNIQARTFEANIHAIAKFNEADLFFYPSFGLSWNIFNGHFSGVADYLNLRRYYQENTYVKTKWIGANVGCGFEYAFKPVNLFGEFKLRLGKSVVKNQINVMDVCFTAGLRYNFRVPTVYGLVKGTRSRYLLDKSKRQAI